MPIRRIVVVAATVNALLLATIGWLVVRRDARGATWQVAGSLWHGTAIDPPMPERPFTLQSSGGPVTLSDLRGDVVLLFFGYTSCPDVCPLTLAKLARVRGALQPDNAAAVRVVLVSVDPEQDSPERLERYVSQFDDSFIGLTGNRAQIEAVARAYGIFHGARVAASSASDSAPSVSRAADGAAQTDPGHATHASSLAAPMIAHTTHVLVLDRAGRLALLWSTSVSAEEMTDDLRRLLRT